MKRGRPLIYDERKVTLAVRVTPTLKAFLADQSDSMGNTLEETVRRTGTFRKWHQARKGKK